MGYLRSSPPARGCQAPVLNIDAVQPLPVSMEARRPSLPQLRSLSPPGVSERRERVPAPIPQHQTSAWEPSRATNAMLSPPGDQAGSRMRSKANGRLLSPSGVQMDSLSLATSCQATARESPPGENAHIR